MGRIIAAEYLTLDGVFENPSWTQPYFDETVGAYQGEAQRWADALLMGRVTYDGMSQAWPTMGNDPATGADIMNSIGKYVPSSTLADPTWNATILSGDLIEEVTKLTQHEDKNLLVYGSGQRPRRCEKRVSSTSTGCSSAPSSWARAAGCLMAGCPQSSPSRAAGRLRVA